MASMQGDVVQNGGLRSLAGGTQNTSAVFDRQNALLVSELNGRYAGLSLAGKLFHATAFVTAPVIYSTAAGTGGPLLWNSPASGVNGQIIAVGFGITVVTTVAAALGITGAAGQNLIPASTTAIDTSGPCFLGGQSAKISSYRVGTPTNAGGFIIPFGDVDTGALTTSFGGMNWIWVDGLYTFGPGSWVSVAATATATTLQATIGLIWVELPV